MRCFKAWLAARGAWQQNSAREEASSKDAGSNQINTKHKRTQKFPNLLSRGVL